MDLFDRLKELREQGLAEIKEAESEKSLNDVRVKLVGKKGELTQILHQMKDVAPEKRREVGQKVNELRDLFNENLASAKDNLIEKAIEARLEAEKIDVTLPGRRKHVGSKHPIRIIQDDLERFFIGMGYQVVQGPEIESEHYNFEMLNLPKDHPARDMQATFYVDADHPTHSHQFMQMEGLVVGKNISLSDLKGTLELVAKHEFGQDRETRLRPSYFPFTEPSVEMDVSCFECGGKGCAICKNTGWIEVLGAGIVHPNVLSAAGIDPSVYSGFAFGLGLDRFAILKYGIDDIRDFYSDDVRFLQQFRQEED